MCEGTLCAIHQTLAVGGGVLSGVRRAHHLKTVFEEWRVVGLCCGRVCVSGHAVRHAPHTGSRRCLLRGEEGTHTSCWCWKNGVWWVCATGESTYSRCQVTLCAMHHTLAVGGVLSGVRRAHTLHAGVGRMACGGSVLPASLRVRARCAPCTRHWQ